MDDMRFERRPLMSFCIRRPKSLNIVEPPYLQGKTAIPKIIMERQTAVLRRGNETSVAIGTARFRRCVLLQWVPHTEDDVIVQSAAGVDPARLDGAIHDLMMPGIY